MSWYPKKIDISTGESLTEAELEYLDNITIGVVAASKAVVPDADKDAGDFRDLDCVNLDAGSAAVAGTVDVFPTTTASGKITIQCADNTSDHALIITNAPVNAANKTLTVPALDGYAAMSTAALSLAEVDVLDAVTPGTVAASKAVVTTTDKHIDTIVITDGGLCLGAGAGTSVSATAAELNVLDTATAGAQVASKAVIAGADKEVAGLKASHAETADGTIPAYRLVKGHTDGTLLVGTLASKRIVGANLENAQKVITNPLKLGAGFVSVVAAEPLIAGDLIKCGDNGRVLQMADADNLDTVIGTDTAGNFANQPANDGVEIVSSSAADVGLNVTIIGTTQATDTLVEEIIATDGADGTTPVSTTKVDWGFIVAVKADAHAGTLTIREASADQTIITLATGVNSAGVYAVPAASQGAHGLIPYIKAAGASTKTVGVKYEPATGAADAYMAEALNGATAAPLPAAANLVKEIYLGDVATGTVATVYTVAAEDDENVCVGKIIETVAAAATGTAYLRP